MISALVIMGVSHATIAFVPNILKLLDRGWFLLVDSLNQMGIHFSAVLCPFMVYLQCLVKKVIFTCNNVDKVSDTFHRMLCPVKVYMYTTALVCKPNSISIPKCVVNMVSTLSSVCTSFVIH